MKLFNLLWCLLGNAFYINQAYAWNFHFNLDSTNNNNVFNIHKNNINNNNNNNNDDDILHSKENEKIHSGDDINEQNNNMDLDLDHLGLNNNKNPVKIWDPINQRERLIRGRFLHITDIHPDSLYKYGYSIDKNCHFPLSNKTSLFTSDKGMDKAPFFGKAMSQCDSPMELMSSTLNWIEQNLKDKIDFIVWTGDNMRHDNDRYNPRTEISILDMNQLVSKTFYEQFISGTQDKNSNVSIDIIPSLGNNDVFPHNLFALGPTLQTREFLKIWYPYIPQEQQKFFQRGLCFIKEIIPNKLAVISINTLYLFKANPLVDNCNSSKQPGYQLLTWLGLVLDEMRYRGIKVWLSGHVPPLLKNLDDSCYNKFTMWVKEYNDIIIGGVYGHMNVDHFVPVDGRKARRDLEMSYLHDDKLNSIKSIKEKILNFDFETMGAKPQNKEYYMTTVKDQYEDIFKRKHKKVRDKDFAIVNVAGSVIPTFNPSFRIWEYNITNLEEGLNDDLITTKEHQESWEIFFTNLDTQLDEIFNNRNEVEMDQENIHVNNAQCKNEDEDEDDALIPDNKFNVKTIKGDKSIPRKKPKNIPLGPAYTPQLFSPERFIQYYLPLDEVNKKFEKLLSEGVEKENAIKEAFDYQVEYTSGDEPYNLNNLFVKDYLKLAKRLIEDKKSWSKYLKYSFISTDYKDE